MRPNLLLLLLSLSLHNAGQTLEKNDVTAELKITNNTPYQELPYEIIAVSYSNAPFPGDPGWEILEAKEERPPERTTIEKPSFPGPQKSVYHRFKKAISVKEDGCSRTFYVMVRLKELKGLKRTIRITDIIDETYIEQPKMKYYPTAHFLIQMTNGKIEFKIQDTYH